MRKENTMTVGQWCGQWFIANRPKWNGNTEGGYRNLIYGHIIPSIGSVALSDLTKQTITDFYDSLQNRGLSARSVWCVHLLLRRCMDEAAREQFIPYNPVRLCQESKAEGYKAAPLRLGQLQRYLNATEQLGVLPLIYTGLSLNISNLTQQYVLSDEQIIQMEVEILLSVEKREKTVNLPSVSARHIKTA